jgi:hypothetical protein
MLLALAGIAMGLLAPSAYAVFPAPAKPVDYNRDIRPILSENCFYCHGQDPNHRKKELRLDQAESAYKKAVIPGNADESPLVKRIFSSDPDEMMPPPDSHHLLTPEQKETMKRWVAQGAKYEEHWAYVAPVRPQLPEVRRKDWVRNPIDAFVLAKLESEGLEPSPEADPITLMRRVTLDLTGLPPTQAEVDAYLADCKKPGAYERLVDRLLASPAYGERMALPWLDAARYADSNGFQQDGDTYQWIWRDWVVRALNADMPFDAFSTDQLAGDLLPNATTDQKIASAFNRNHLLNGEGGAIPEEQRNIILFDRVDTTATTWLALTVACAQCHDHKFDPITQRDYYSLMAAFNQIPETGVPGGGPGRIRVAAPFIELPTDENKATIARLSAELKAAEKEADSTKRFDAELAKWEATVTADTPGLDRAILPILREKPEERTKAEVTQLKNGLRKQFEKKVFPEIAAKDPALKRATDLKNELARYKNEEVPRVMIMSDAKHRDTHILDRGNYENPRDTVSFNTPAFLPPMPKDAPRNRLGLARWLFIPENPLTARVQVNRYWQYFFGVGLVKSSEDLGVQSEMPVYQDVLDWLAVEFRQPSIPDSDECTSGGISNLKSEISNPADCCSELPHAWSMKHIHRLIVTSATYRQSSRVTRALLARDPENRLLARGGRFRLPAMVLRDVALATSGLLDHRIGGTPVYPYQPQGIWDSLAITKERDFTYPQSHGADLYRRSLYTFWRRTVAPADVFDNSNRQTCRVRLAVTCTPLHALTTLDDVTWVESARVLAAHAMESNEGTDARLTFAFRQVLAREPRESEMKILRHMFDRQRTFYAADPKAAEAAISVGDSPKNESLNVPDHAALSAVCLAILNMDEALSHE